LTVQSAHRRYGDGRTATGTFFAPAIRSSQHEIEGALRVLENHRLLSNLFETLEVYVLILNRHRQIVYANEEILRALGVNSLEEATGFRPGEALQCVHAWENESGCGTSRHCDSCGAVLAILASLELKEPIEKECLLTSRQGAQAVSWEFHVRATPFEAEGETFTILSLVDVSQAKRRETLERLFFHDLLNIIGGLNGLAYLLKHGGGPGNSRYLDQIELLTLVLQREVENQRLLAMAERGEISLALQETKPAEVIRNVERICREFNAAKGKRIETIVPAETLRIQTDPTLLERVLLNMAKNALEAIGPRESIRMWLEAREGEVIFHVWNPGLIPERTAKQIFVRSFSTKGEAGRGLGTYSMKLFGEKYLRGRVFFHTDEQEGTTFSIALPRCFAQ